MRKNYFWNCSVTESIPLKFIRLLKKICSKPEKRNEVYVIIPGKGEFINGNVRTNFQPGDFIFVPQGAEHRYINFTGNFSTWVIPYGPKGSESKAQ